MANACGKECSKLPSGGGAACAHAALARRDKPMLALTEVSRIDAHRPLKSRTSRDACPPSLRPSWNTSFIRYAIAPAVLRAPNEYVNIVIHTILVQIWVDDYIDILIGRSKDSRRDGIPDEARIPRRP